MSGVPFLVNRIVSVKSVDSTRQFAKPDSSIARTSNIWIISVFQIIAVRHLRTTMIDPDGIVDIIYQKLRLFLPASFAS